MTKRDLISNSRVETISKHEEFGENESLETLSSKNSESIHNGFSKDTDPLNTETSAMSGDTNQNNSIHLDSLPCSEEISFSEIGKESIDPDSETSDQNEDDMPPLIDNESVTNEKEKESEPKSNKNNISEITDNKNTSLEENINPETIKENDVKDECLHENNEEKTVDDDNKEEEEYLDILGNGSLKRKILSKAPKNAKRPISSDVVTIKVEGKLEDGTKVDVFESLTFVLGDGDVIQAWDLAVALMEEGQVIELQTDARFAYGEKGRKPDIPPNSSISYIIELVKKEYPLDYESMSATEKLNYGEKKRERGNFLFSREDYVSAINSYNKAVRILDPATCSDAAESLQKLLESRLKCYNNMAACQLKTDAYDAAIKSCRMVLDVQPENVKALFRTGKGFAAKGETKEGLMFMRKAQKLDPDTKVINQEIMKLSKKLQAESQSEKNMYQKMLGQKPSAKVDKNSQNSSSMWKWTSVIGGVAIAVVAMGITAYRHLQH
ncbi:peptidyl-prolyl cis-trans isomerase FKBP8-like isoform X2 [Crassostrea virginica]